jgi:zinc/manganese transport system substrate-binding protein
MKIFSIFIIIFLVLTRISGAFSAEKLNVVTTLSVYADIARDIGGDEVDVKAIVSGDQDAHYVKPKPSYAVWMNKADVFIETGLDLEIWAPTLIDKSRNPRIRSGQPGYIAVADGVPMLQVPAAPDRSQGDVHIYGNPHIFTSPLNAKIIAQNIAIGLSKVRPEKSEYFQVQLKNFDQEIDNRLFGEQLVGLLGGETLTQLTRSGNLISFLNTQSFQGQPLIQYLGGWMKQMLSLRGLKLIGYHQNWVYFEKLFNLDIIGYVEPKPGIPPSPKHVEQLIKQMKQQNARIILSANYFDERKVREIANKIGGIAVIVPLGVTNKAGNRTYFELVSYWINQLVEAFDSIPG